MDEADLARFINNHPIIDNHAHNILLSTHEQTIPFLSITSEAQGEALETSRWSLANARAGKALKRLYKCQDDSWSGIEAARGRALAHRDYLYDECFRGTHTILMDDGLDSDSVHHYAWHDRYCVGRTRRIVRIEAVAESILEQQLIPKYKQQHTIGDLKDMKLVERYLENLGHTFHDSIRDYTKDKDVAGFKSVICYRSGLSINIEEHSEREIDDLVAAFASWFRRCLRRETSKVNSKILNDWLVSICLFILSGSAEVGHVKPMQFHTGLGDNDLSLKLANPAHMQPLIEKFPRVPVVLLHSSYPYTREAGYLASVYRNVFLDLGLAFPMLSRSGQESVLRQAFELVPTRKLLWSTDGHWFGETYWLANMQFREALTKVLMESVRAEDLTFNEASEAARDILFSNSNHLYNLGIRLSHSYSRSTTPASKSISNTTPATSATSLPTTEQRFHPSDIQVLKSFELGTKNLAFVYVQWLDLLGTTRARILPIAELRNLLEHKETISISRGNLGTLQNDELTDVVNTTGAVAIKPDMHTLRPTHHLDTLRSPSRSSATAMASILIEDHKPHPLDPRSSLQTLLTTLHHDHNLALNLGFEIEVTFLRRSGEGYAPYTANHACNTLTPEQWQSLELLRDIYDGLAAIGVHVQQMHAESCPGQYEFILPPLPCLQAVDTLIQARQVIAQIAQAHGVRASLHPSPLDGNGTAAHVHLSLSSTSVDGSEEPVAGDVEGNFFLKGILHHLRAACAILLPSAPSYIRVADDVWTGGSWVAWGTQNRECPLRKVNDGRWEIRCVDGMGNPYLQVLAVVAAGFQGLRASTLIGAEPEGRTVPRECLANPARLSHTEREDLGITERLPNSLDESLEALENDDTLQDILGKDLISHYITMKRAEQAMLQKMPNHDRHRFLVERY